MRTQGEIEAAICQGMTRFEQEYMGRGPKDIRTHLIDDLVVVRLQGVLTAAEQHLVESLPAEKGRDLLKQVRTHLLETARPLMEKMVHPEPAYISQLIPQLSAPLSFSEACLWCPTVSFALIRLTRI